jgi:hypothetical protein
VYAIFYLYERKQDFPCSDSAYGFTLRERTGELSALPHRRHVGTLDISRRRKAFWFSPRLEARVSAPGRGCVETLAFDALAMAVGSRLRSSTERTTARDGIGYFHGPIAAVERRRFEVKQTWSSASVHNPLPHIAVGRRRKTIRYFGLLVHKPGTAERTNRNAFATQPRPSVSRGNRRARGRPTRTRQEAPAQLLCHPHCGGQLLGIRDKLQQRNPVVRSRASQGASKFLGAGDALRVRTE